MNSNIKSLKWFKDLIFTLAQIFENVKIYKKINILNLIATKSENFIKNCYFKQYYYIAAKSTDLLRTRGPQWITVSTGGHGWAAVYAAAGEGGEDGRGSGGQGLESRAAVFSFLIWFITYRQSPSTKIQKELCFFNPRYGLTKIEVQIHTQFKTR